MKSIRSKIIETVFKDVSSSSFQDLDDVDEGGDEDSDGEDYDGHDEL